MWKWWTRESHWAFILKQLFPCLLSPLLCFESINIFVVEITSLFFLGASEIKRFSEKKRVTWDMKWFHCRLPLCVYRTAILWHFLGTSKEAGFWRIPRIYICRIYLFRCLYKDKLEGDLALLTSEYNLIIGGWIMSASHQTPVRRSAEETLLCQSLPH